VVQHKGLANRKNLKENDQDQQVLHGPNLDSFSCEDGMAMDKNTPVAIPVTMNSYV
jgi:hypothetical protein